MSEERKEAFETIINKLEWEGGWEALANYGDLKEMKEFPILQQSWESFTYALNNLNSVMNVLEEQYEQD